jgi:putative transposase
MHAPVASPRRRRLQLTQVDEIPRPPRRLDWIYKRNSLYFVTCCTYRRRPLLAKDQIHAAFIAFAEQAEKDHGIAVGRYIILPDYLHLFIAGPRDFSLEKWVGTLKRVLGKVIEHTDSRDPIWQRGFFDHVLRSEESYSQKWNYVRENPVRVSLAKNADDWPYTGEIVAIYYRGQL